MISEKKLKGARESAYLRQVK